MVTRQSKRLLAVVLFVSMAALLIGGCGKSNTNGAASSPAGETNSPSASSSEPATTNELESLTKDHVTLKWYFPGNVQNMTDKASVEAEMNKILNAEINASIELVPIDWGAYDQKMNIMSAGGEEFDLMFTAPWSNDYYKNVARGALLPLDELMDKYAPNLKGIVPEKVWEAAD